MFGPLHSCFNFTAVTPNIQTTFWSEDFGSGSFGSCSSWSGGVPGSSLFWWSDWSCCSADTARRSCCCWGVQVEWIDRSGGIPGLSRRLQMISTCSLVTYRHNQHWHKLKHEQTLLMQLLLKFVEGNIKNYLIKGPTLRFEVHIIKLKQNLKLAAAQNSFSVVFAGFRNVVLTNL